MEQQPVDQQQLVQQQQLMQQQLMQQQLMQQQPVQQQQLMQLRLMQQRIILQRPLQPGGPPRYHEAEEQKARRRRVNIMRSMKERAGKLRGDIPHPDGHPLAGVLPSRSYHPEEQINNRYARTRWNDFGTQIAQARYGGGNFSKGYNINLESIIAAGGFGIAALVRHRSTRDWARKLCVMKVERSKFRDKTYMDQEEMALKRFQGAKHIVQYLDRTQEIKDQRDADNAGKGPYIPRKTAEEMDKNWDIKQQRDRRFIIVEYAEGGNLDQWLAKSSRSGKPWPNKALWLLFKCLVKGLIGMGYPPKKIYADDPNFDPNHPVDETIPKEGFAMENTAHFDLDPLNVLVAKDEEHEDMPIFKIADFGNAVFFDEQEKNPEKFTKEAFWKHRYRGKTHTLAPEQFDASWDSMLDFIDDISPNQFVAKDGSKPSVAGNYGMHTNVYQIGLIMWCAITRSWFDSPVVAAWYPDYNRASGFRTYGASLQSKRFTKVDEALKIIIQRCMAHNPADRPTLDALEKIVDSRLKLNGLESDEEVSNWAKEFFDSPRCPGDDVDPPARRWKRSRPLDDDDEEYWRASQRLKTEHEDDVQPDPKLHVPRVPVDSRVAQFPAAGFQPGGPMYQQPMQQQAQQQAPEGFQPRVPSIGAALGGNNWANGPGYQQQQQQQQFQPQLQPFHGAPLNQGLQQGQQLNPGANVFQPQQQQPQQQYPQFQNPPLQYQQAQDPQQRVLQFQTPQPQFEPQFQWPVLQYLQQQPQPQYVQDQQPQYNQVQQPQYLQDQQQQYAQYQQPQYQQPQYQQPQQQQHQYQQAQYQQAQYHQGQQQQYDQDQEPQNDGFQQYHFQ